MFCGLSGSCSRTPTRTPKLDPHVGPPDAGGGGGGTAGGGGAALIAGAATGTGPAGCGEPGGMVGAATGTGPGGGGGGGNICGAVDAGAAEVEAAVADAGGEGCCARAVPTSVRTQKVAVASD